MKRATNTTATTRNGDRWTAAPSTPQIVREFLEAADRSSKRIAGSPTKARAFLIRAGILTKSGKQLAKPYR